MTTSAETADKQLLVALQKGLPLEPRPFARLSAPLGLTEAAVLEKVHALFASGVARRFGAVFDARSLGYESTLCATDLPTTTMEAAARRIVSHPGITHCYERDGHPNLWFTMTAPAGEVAREIERVAAALGAAQAVWSLPALRLFKIEAVFGKESEAAARPAAARATTPAAPLTEREQQVVRRLQADLAVTENPFGTIAAELAYDSAELLALLQRWQQSGIIRRIGLVLRHRQLGLSANSMCVWPVPPERIEAAGTSLARSPHVSHCYERPCFAAFPYNLYAMIHAPSREAAVALFEQLQGDAGLTNGRMLWSMREFKKASPIFFGAPPPTLEGPTPA
jgi:DNA-binding Lrp family transcriptional regulator